MMWKEDAVDAPPGNPDLEGSVMVLGHGLNCVANESSVVMMNHECDSTGSAQKGASHEN